MQLDRSAAAGHFEGCLYAVTKLSRERAFRSERHRRKGFSAAIVGTYSRTQLAIKVFPDPFAKKKLCSLPKQSLGVLFKTSDQTVALRHSPPQTPHE